MKRFTYFEGQVARDQGGRFYGRFLIAGRPTWRRLKSIGVKAAREERWLLQSNHERAALGLCDDPFRPRLTIADLVDRYIAAGCPDRRRMSRDDDQRAAIAPHLVKIRECLGTQPADQVTVATCDRYHDWRITQAKRGEGHRAAEIELSTLSTVLAWAARAELIRANPLAAGRPSYRRGEDIRHCTAVMPTDDDELHLIANHLLGDPDSEACAWQLLIEALTGCRTSEVLRLRWDAAPGQPGHITGTFLYVDRSKKGGHATSLFPYVLLDQAPGVSPLRPLLEALRVWHQERFPASPWFLPGRWPDTSSDPGRLTHALTRACHTLGLPHRTSHGLRAYYVRVCRSLGIDDHEISKRLGHRSGVQLVERTYGVPEPGWFGGRTLDWLPTPQSEDNLNPAPCAWAPWIRTAAADTIVQMPVAGDRKEAAQ